MMVKNVMQLCDSIEKLQSVAEDLLVQVPRDGRVLCVDIIKELGLALSDAKRLERVVASAAMNE